MYDNLNTIDENNESSSENSEFKHDCLKNSRKNANGNQAVLLEVLNLSKGRFIIKNFANLSKRNLNDAEIYLLPKRLSFVSACNNIYIYIYTYIYIFIYLYIHIYIYIKLKLKCNWRPLVECYV